MDHILAAKNVSKSYGNKSALSNISLEIPENSIYGLLGPNGAGKTTFIRIINQIARQDSGSLFFMGEPLVPKHIAHIGYLPEERGLYKSMRVGEQALYLARLKGLSRSEAKARLKFWFDRLDIGDWWNKKIQELSKGMAQKIQFIVTVLHQPKLIIFDEPFSGFDPINANIIKDEILGLRDRGATIIFSTHRMESVEELCQYIALIHNSEMILEGRLSDIKKAYKNNIFEVGLHTEGNWEEKVQEMAGRFNIISSRMDSKTGQMDLKVQLPSPNTSQLLMELSQWGNVNHFEETVPSANDIFIQTVNNKDHGN